MSKIDSFMGEYRWLSNFHLCDIEYEGIVYPSTEHAYQAAKTLKPEKRLEFLKLTCGGAKRRGGKLKLRPDWESIKVKVMYDVLVSKFEDPYLAKLLMETYPKELVEGNTWGDRFWGVCEGEGLNTLGKLLMQIRDILLSERS